MPIDLTISANVLLQTATLLLVLSGIYWALHTEVKLIKNDLTHLKEAQKSLTEAFSQLGKILTQVAVQDARMVQLEKKIDELAHGDGIILKRNK